MNKVIEAWVYVFIAVAIAVSGNSVSSIWAKGENKFSIWLLALLIISPLVFITFGLTTSKIGVAVASGVVDSLLTFSTIAIGLFFFQEWNKVSSLQYVGMLFALTGTILMVFFPKASIS